MALSTGAWIGILILCIFLCILVFIGIWFRRRQIYGAGKYTWSWTLIEDNYAYQLGMRLGEEDFQALGRVEGMSDRFWRAIQREKERRKEIRQEND